MEQNPHVPGAGHHVGVGDDIAVPGEHHAGAGAVAVAGLRLNGHHRGAGLFKDLRVAQGLSPGGEQGHRHPGAQPGLGDGGGLVVQAALLSPVVLLHRGEIVPDDGGCAVKVPVQQNGGQADERDQGQQAQEPGPFPAPPPGSEHRAPGHGGGHADGGRRRIPGVVLFPGSPAPQAVVSVVHDNTPCECHASVSVN